MVWEALHCDRLVAREALAAGIAETLGIAAGELSLADSIEKADRSARVLVAYRERSGEFNMTIDIISGDDEVAARIDDDALRAMCARWGCRGLVSDGGDNPYRMTLLRQGAPDEAVYIDAAAFDDHDEIHVTGPASTIPAPQIPEGRRSQRRITPPPPPQDEGDTER